MSSENSFLNAARLLDVELSTIKAVAEVESKGNGFLNGQPLILFEPHVFWKELKQRGIRPEDHVAGNEDILYEAWGKKPYGTYGKQHDRLGRAAKIHREAALSSASWGRFQIMGFNWESCGCSSLQEFINTIYGGEDGHLQLFCHYIRTCGLDKHLRNRDWAAFAERYNGKGFRKNKYDTKLQAAYEKHRKSITA